MIKNIFKNWEIIILTIIIIACAFLRLYRIEDYMTFLGDEGRDVRVVSRILQGDMTFIGPMTSVTTSSGHMFLGPGYYYMMAPFLFLSGGHPIGPAIMVALLSGLTVGLIWWIGRTWFHPVVGLIASFLYSISSVTIIYGRSSWNPNVMPFFAVLAIWGVVEALKSKTTRWWIISGIGIAGAMQSHYLGLILFPIIGLIGLLRIKQLKTHWKNWLLGASIIGAIFLLSQVPVVLFDYKHGWQNLSAMKAFFTERETTVNLKIYVRLKEYLPLLSNIFSRLLNINYVGQLLVGITIVSSLLLSYFTKRLRFETLVMFIWCLVGVLGMSIYKQNIFDHYFGFLYPIPFLLLGWSIWILATHSWNGKCDICMKIRWVWLSGLLLFFTIGMLNNLPIKQSPNKQWNNTDRIAKIIIEKSQNKEFNLGLLANTYDEHYRFALERRNSKLVSIDPQRPETITDQLFVICEIQCQPIGNAQSEIANFGWAQVSDIYKDEITGFQIFKLTHMNQNPVAQK